LNAKIEEETDVKDAKKVTDVGDSNANISMTTPPATAESNINNNNNTTSGTSIVGRPFLRSSPILSATKTKENTTSTTSATKNANTTTSTTITTATSTSAASPSTTEQKKKERKTKQKRNVSWAKDDELVQVVSIDNQMELIKSWNLNLKLPCRSPR